MTKQSNTILIGKIDEGRFVAVNTSGPHFCFEAGSEQDAIALSKRALDFYYGSEGFINDDVAQPVSRQLVRASRTRKETIQTPMAA